MGFTNILKTDSPKPVNGVLGFKLTIIREATTMLSTLQPVNRNRIRHCGKTRMPYFTALPTAAGHARVGIADTLSFAMIAYCF
jgi:hypothetical protein